MNIDPARAERAFEDVVAVEWDEDAGTMRIVTFSDVYFAVPEDGMHMCPDREYNDVEICKHVVAVEATRGNIDVPTPWIVTADLDDRDADRPEECECTTAASMPCFACYRAGFETPADA